jgi:hypothetical protein
MATASFIVHAGPHSRRNCPLLVSLPDVEGTPPPAVRLVTESGGEVPAQLVLSTPGWRRPAGESCHQVAFVLPALAAGESLRLTAHFGDFTAPADRVTVDASQTGRVEVSVDGALLTAYRYEGNPARPCFFPVLGPGGVRVTRSWPIEDTVAGETQDHVHHRSLWVAHGEVNRTDNWSEAPGHAFQLDRGVLAATGGPVRGVLAATTDWTTADSRKVLEEVRVLTAYAVSDEMRLFDFDVVFTATECDVRFGDTKEGGILALRVAPAMDGDHGGTIENAYGGLGEAECWGKRAPWCDYHGEIAGTRLGIALLDHPTSFRHPTHWHVRDYGMYTANPFGWHDFAGDPSVDGSHLLPRGASLAFRYRVYLHRGDTASAEVAARYHDFANPPRVEVLG